MQYCRAENEWCWFIRKKCFYFTLWIYVICWIWGFELRLAKSHRSADHSLTKVTLAEGEPEKQQKQRDKKRWSADGHMHRTTLSSFWSLHTQLYLSKQDVLFYCSRTKLKLNLHQRVCENPHSHGADQKNDICLYSEYWDQCYVWMAYVKLRDWSDKNIYTEFSGFSPLRHFNRTS